MTNYMFTIVDTVDNRQSRRSRSRPMASCFAQRAAHDELLGGARGLRRRPHGTLNDRTYSDLDDDNAMRADTKAPADGWGITDKYWMAAVIPPQSEEFNGTYKAFDVNGSKAYQSDFLLTPKTVAPNGSQTVVHHLFAGAKVVDIVDDYTRTLGIKPLRHGRRLGLVLIR